MRKTLQNQFQLPKISNPNVMARIFRIIETIDNDDPDYWIVERRWIIAKKYIRLLFDKCYSYNHDIFMYHAKSRIDRRIELKFGDKRKCMYHIPTYMYR